jgi:hypothetical protein
MDKNLIDLIARILDVVTYMLFGGLVAITFFYVFAPWILGLPRMQHHLKKLEEQSENTNRLLTSIEEQLKKLNENKNNGKP